MPRTTRRSTRKLAIVETSDEENYKSPPKRLRKPPKTTQQSSKDSNTTQKPTNKDDSSSESDLETYLKPADQIDLTSSFFDIHKNHEEVPFEAVEKNIFSGIDRLSESESEEDVNENTLPTTSAAATSKINFQQLHSYTKKLEEAKKVVEKYEAQKKATLKKVKRGKHKKGHSEDSISDLLAKGETKVDSQEQLSMHSSDYESFSDSEHDWEEVKEHSVKEQKALIPKEGIQITVQMPEVIRKKKGIDLLASMKRRLNRIRKDNQVYVHKVHLLCWLAHGNYVNTVLNNENTLGIAMSLLPSQHCYPKERTDLSYLEAVVKWFSNAIPITDKAISDGLPLDKVLHLQMNQKQAYNKKMLVYIFICMLRALGIQCRLVLSFIVTPLRPPAEELHSLSIKNNDNKSSKSTNKKAGCNQNGIKLSNGHQTPSSSKDHKEKIKHTSKSNNATEKHKKEPTNKIKKSTDKNPQTRSNNSDISGKKPQSTNTSKPNLKNLKESKSRQPKSHTSKAQIPQVDGANDSDSAPKKQTKKPNLKKLTQQEKNTCSNRKHPKRLKSLPNYADHDSEDDFKTKIVAKPLQQSKVNLKRLNRSNPDVYKPSNVQNDIIAIIKGRMAEERASEKSKLVKRRSRKDNDYDSDYAPEIKRKHDSDDEKPKIKVKRRIPVKPEDDKTKKKGNNVWVEVYLENEEKWISVDCIRGEIHCVNQLYSRASHPVTYIVAWNNNNSVKDITQRYCPNWNTVTRKLRIDKLWWASSLKPFTGRKTVRDKEEDEELARLQLEQPLPKTINEYKDHPLYALKRHLLKFQALYPPDSILLGFVREEPVYSRDCVHTLHSRETWLKHAKVVKLGEKPYKVVKARPKYDKLSGQVITDQPLDVFGKWQVEDYVPPTAKDGIVPRNAYGNVELFKACMLPKGTVHLQLPGLNKVARKMNIDCVPAVVGFDIHSGWTHPTFDGFVVCEEFSESLIAAWYLEQEEQEKREQEKMEKRVYDNWKKLIKGLLIRERLKARYDYGAPSQSETKKRKNKGPKLVTKKRRICSDDESS